MNLSLITEIADSIERVFLSTSILSQDAGIRHIDRQEFLERMSLFGFQRIGNGVYRTVFTHELTPEVVYKFGDSFSNMKEFNIFSHISHHKKSCLATIYYTNGLVNVMERVLHSLYQETSEAELIKEYGVNKEEWPHYKECLTLLFDEGFQIDDMHLANLGRTEDGRIVVIDYGSEHSTLKKEDDDKWVDIFPSWRTTMDNHLSWIRKHEIDHFQTYFDQYTFSPTTQSLSPPNQTLLSLIEEHDIDEALLVLDGLLMEAQLIKEPSFNLINHYPNNGK